MKLVALNTIGLTGVEIFQAHLAGLEDVLVLPGQNFTLHRQNLYRPHDYSALAGPEIFRIGKPEATTSVLICFEDSFPQYAREHVETDTDFLLNLPKDHKDVYNAVEAGTGVGYVPATLDLYKDIIELRLTEKRGGRS